MVDASGHVLAESISGPSNIRLSVPEAVCSIEEGFSQCLKTAGIPYAKKKNYLFRAGIGLAGYEVKSAREEFFKTQSPFDFLALESDATIACLGAHDGKNGSIVIAGTGVVGLKISRGKKHQIGGWGFPHGDEGGGAWLGLEAVKKCLHAIDHKEKDSLFMQELREQIGSQKEAMTQWACNSNATDYASLTPLIVKHAEIRRPRRSTK